MANRVLHSFCFQFPDRLPFQLNDVGSMHNSVKNGIRNGWIIKQVILFTTGELACDNQRALRRLLVDDFQQYWTNIDVDPANAQVIND